MLTPRSHLALKRGVFYYRRKLPKTYGGDVAVSLRTKGFREAQHLATLLDSSFDRFFRTAPLMTDIRELLRQRLAETLREDREQHLATPHGRPVYATLASLDDDTSPTDADLELVADWLSERREALATRDFSLVKSDVADLMARHRIPETKRSELALGLLQLEVEYLETARHRLVRGVALPIGSEPIPTSTVAASQPTPPAPEGPKLSEVLPAFTDLMVKEGGWRGHTLGQNKSTYQLFMGLNGDLPVHEYKRAHFSTMYDALRALPVRYATDRRWREMTPPEYIAATKGEDVPRLTMKTMKRHFSALGPLFKYLIERGQYEGTNPAYGFSFPKKGRQNQKRQMWEGEKLQKLFASPVWTGCASESRRSKPGPLIIKDDKYWLPLLALYHGNRLEEFAQLVRADIRVQDGIHYFDINDDDGKHVKNAQSKRRVPIHPSIVDAGFLDYVTEIAPAAGDPLFPKLPPSGVDNKRGGTFTAWWTYYRRAVGVYELGLDYHSFRHGVTTKLFAANVTEAIIDELTGHEGGGTSRVVYKKDLPLKTLYEAICKLEWPEVTVAAGG